MINKILIVDDSAAIHQTYQMTLARYKGLVLTALSGVEGLNLLASNPDVDLLIVDMNMPHMSGIEFIKRVKEQEAFNSVPIIAVIMKEKEGDSQEARQLSQGILKKPFTSGEIHLEIGRLFPEGVGEAKTF